MIRRLSGPGPKIAFKLVLIVAAVVVAVQMNRGSPGSPAQAPARAAQVSAPTRQAARPRSPAPPVASATATPVAAEEPFVVRRILDVPEPIRIGDWHWDDAGVPPGEIVVTADLQAGTLSIFRGGYEIGTAAIIYGIDYKPTPTGTFTITQKDRDHVSNLYDAPMPYMMRLTNDGVSIHGSHLTANGATHGCIGVPIPFAAKLFAAVKVGTPVLVTNAGLRKDAARVPNA